MIRKLKKHPLKEGEFVYTIKEKRKRGIFMPVKVGLKHIEIWDESMEAEVLEYEKENPEKGQIVFYGPSHFTRWSKKWGETPMSEVLLGKSGKQCVINRGFGSTCAEHHLYYYPRMIKPLAPKVLVYHCAMGNGMAFGYSPDENWELSQRVLTYARTDFPDIHIYVCGTINQANMTEAQIQRRLALDEKKREFVKETPNCHFIDIMGYEPMRNDDVFVEDGVHLSKEGYKIFGELFKNALRDELDKY